MHSKTYIKAYQIWQKKIVIYGKLSSSAEWPSLSSTVGFRVIFSPIESLMKLILEAKEIVKLQKIRFYVLFILGCFWSVAVIALYAVDARNLLLIPASIFALAILILYFIVFPFWGAYDAKRIIRIHANSQVEIPIESSTFLSVIITILIVFAIFPREVILFSDGIGGYFIALLLGVGNVFGGYKLTARIIGWLIRSLHKIGTH